MKIINKKQNSSHVHNNEHFHSHEHNAVKNIKLAFFLNLFFTIIEFIGGYLTNSVAVTSDALHDLGDSFSLGLAWFLQNFSNKKSNKKFSYGFKRFSLLGALINGLILLIGSLFILNQAFSRIINPMPVNAKLMIFLAMLGILFNGFAVFKTNKGESLNEKVISLHLLEDVLGWIAVFIVSIILLFTNFYILDPILSILITLYILYSVLKNLKRTFLLFMQAVPKNINYDLIYKNLKNLKEVYDLHDLHIWSLDGEKNILTSHIILNDKKSIFDFEKIISLKKEIRKNMKKFNISDCTLEFELKKENCQNFCK